MKQEAHTTLYNTWPEKNSGRRQQPRLPNGGHEPAMTMSYVRLHSLPPPHTQKKECGSLDMFEGFGCGFRGCVWNWLYAAMCLDGTCYLKANNFAINQYRPNNN